MIYSEETNRLLECTYELVKNIKNSQEYQKYREAEKNLDNPSTQIKKEQFMKAKQEMQQIEEYSKYAPEYKEIKKKLRDTKRILDLDEAVKEFRYCEFELQQILDDIVANIAQVISDDINVHSGNPFKKQHKCGGCMDEQRSKS